MVEIIEGQLKPGIQKLTSFEGNEYYGQVSYNQKQGKDHIF
jgi:hypothetical protein